ncbi:protein NUCLEAR FUSION DEFECTIVE 6, mitochondrial-like isoform X2 [Curcuma longa]|uniref:protein NUCLEAR FUSION DEFECTIVE 6, mitochondrial-like isoform X2 n=1 Tax=Curcuma longa TaxID=136217 RepID=UPI003D9E2E5E
MAAAAASAASASRSVLRSLSLRTPASRVVAVATTASCPTLRHAPNLRPAVAARYLRSAVVASFCLESLMPMHSATASALMTSMLSVSRKRYGGFCEVGSDDA